jgi:hypothetical protein
MDLIESGVRDPIKHWYYQHKYWFIKNSSLRKIKGENSLADIGAGSALFSRELLQKGLVNKVVAVDTGYLKESEIKDGITYRRSVNYSGFSHFLLTDVLEHVEKDGDFLSRVVTEADINSVFIITVPALMSLWSGHDVYLKHFRRYNKGQLRLLVEDSGLRVKSIRYTYLTVFLAALLQRKFFGKKSGNSQMKENSLFTSLVMQIMLVPDRWVSFLPFGVSLFVEATKNE